MSREKNLDIWRKIKESGLSYADIAKRMGISRSWLQTLLRSDLSDANRDRILQAIMTMDERIEPVTVKVFCKDCKHFRAGHGVAGAMGAGFCCHESPGVLLVRYQSDYCSMASRRGGK